MSSMKLEEALDIVYQLADANALSEYETIGDSTLIQELEKQIKALDMVYDLLELLKRK